MYPFKKIPNFGLWFKVLHPLLGLDLCALLGIVSRTERLSPVSQLTCYSRGDAVFSWSLNILVLDSLPLHQNKGNVSSASPDAVRVCSHFNLPVKPHADLFSVVPGKSKCDGRALSCSSVVELCPALILSTNIKAIVAR